MIYIGSYEELIPGKGYDSLRDHMEASPYPHQETIVNYLRSGEMDMFSLQLPKDVFTGQRIPGEKLGMNDGVYTWWNTLAYYVEKYNLRLPKNFEEHVLRQTGKK